MKKYKDLFQIGEVASLFNISRKMILNYESQGLLAPTLIDNDTGYRYFDAPTIARLQLILDLRRTDMPIADIEKYLNGKLSAESQIAKLKAQISAMENAIEQLSVRKKEKNEPLHIRLTHIPERCCICRDFIADNVDAAIDAVVATYDSCIERKLHFVKGGHHFNEFPRDIFAEDFYELENIKIRVCIVVDDADAPPDAVIYPATKALYTSFCGGYDQSYEAYEALKKYIVDNGYKTCGYPREIYLEGNFDSTSDKNIICVVVPIED